MNPFADLATLSRTESWKYTSLDFLKSRAAMPADADAVVPESVLRGACRMVFVGGVFDAAHSSTDCPQGVTHGLMRQQGEGGHPVMQLNNAGARDGAIVRIAPGAVPELPVELVFCGADGLVHNQISIELGDEAQLTIVEDHDYQGACNVTTVARISLGDGASLRHYRLHSAGAEVVSLSTGAVTLGRDAHYNSFALTLGGQLTRHQVLATMTAPGAHLELNGAHVLDGDSHADTTTEIRHMAPHCASRETYRHVMDGTSRSVFQGKIYVAQDAQKTDGFQLNQSLMLSAQAEVNAKPELEIYADDVKCSHGATSGRLDEDALFYLRSRGLPQAEARAMLVEAFIGSAIDLISDEPVREAFRAVATSALHKKISDAEAVHAE